MKAEVDALWRKVEQGRRELGQQGVRARTASAAAPTAAAAAAAVGSSLHVVDMRGPRLKEFRGQGAIGALLGEPRGAHGRRRSDSGSSASSLSSSASSSSSSSSGSQSSASSAPELGGRHRPPTPPSVLPSNSPSRKKRQAIPELPHNVSQLVRDAEHKVVTLERAAENRRMARSLKDKDRLKLEDRISKTTGEIQRLREFIRILDQALSPDTSAVDACGALALMQKEFPGQAQSLGLESRLVPALLSSAWRTWDVTDPEPALELVEQLVEQRLVSEKTLDKVLQVLLVPRLVARLDGWEPSAAAEPLAERDAPHLWIMPWLPFIPNALADLLPAVRHALQRALRACPLSKPSLAEHFVRPWRGFVSAARLEALVVRAIVPRLVQELRVSHARLHELAMGRVQAVLAWSELVPRFHLVGILQGEFFPRWVAHLDSQLAAADADFARVADEYDSVKRSMPGAVVDEPRIIAQFDAVLTLMKNALDDEWDEGNDEPLPPPALHSYDQVVDYYSGARRGAWRDERWRGRGTRGAHRPRARHL